MSKSPSVFMKHGDRKTARSNYNSQSGFFEVPLDHEAPIVVCDCMAYIRNNGYYKVGVFRVPGNKDVVSSLKKEYNERFNTKYLKENSGYSVLNSFEPAPNVNDVASLMKLFFTDLPEPLIPKEATETLFAICAKKYSAAEEAKYYKKVLDKLKSPNRELLGLVITFLRELICFQAYNNMTAANCATCFVLPFMGKTVSADMMKIALGGKIITRLLTCDKKFSMPSSTHVGNNTRYFDSTEHSEKPSQVKREAAGKPVPSGPPPHKYDGLAKPRVVKRNTQALDNEVNEVGGEYGADALDLFGGFVSERVEEQETNSDDDI